MQQKVPSNLALPTDLAKNLGVDYIVHEMTDTELRFKYHLSYDVYFQLVDSLQLRQKKEAYRRTLLDKAIARLTDKQSTIMVKAVNIMLREMNKIEKIQDHLDTLPEDENDRLKSKLARLLPVDFVEQVMKMFVLVTKEARLEQGKPTENVITKVIVEMAPTTSGGVVFKKPTIDVTPIPAEAAPPPQLEKPAEPPKPEKKEEIRVEVEGMGMPL